MRTVPSDVVNVRTVPKAKKQKVENRPQGKVINVRTVPHNVIIEKYGNK